MQYNIQTLIAIVNQLLEAKQPVTMISATQIWHERYPTLTQPSNADWLETFLTLNLHQNADRDMALLDTDSEYANSQRNEPVNPETLAEAFEDASDEDSNEPLWQRFATALATAKLEDPFGNQCTIDDFMLMYIDDRGKAAFKDSCTRQYAYLEADGNLIADGTYFHF